MDWFPSRDGELYAEQVPVTEIAEQFGTPAYIYSRKGFEEGFKAYKQALEGWPHLICYAVKANSNLAVLNVLAKLGAGFDIVSVGELERVIAAGGEASKVVFSGVGKQRHEIRRALELGIHCFNIESETELERIQQEAEIMGKVAAVSVRVNPDVDARTHPYISTGLKDNKFGIDIKAAPAVYQRAAELANIEVVGVDCHIGSQLTTKEPFIDALDRLLLLVDQLREMGIILKHLDIGGGLGISYEKHEQPPTPSEYLGQVREHLAANEHHKHLKIVVEPGRSIAAQAGMLITEVELIKQSDHKAFAVVDAAMNDLLRPSIYSAWHGIEPVVRNDERGELLCDVVGPICETGDFLGKDRKLKVAEGDLLAVRSAGAYGFGMSSNYNSRCRPAEIMVDGDQVHLVRRRERLADQWANEILLPEG
ncbi:MULTISPECIES: diaminopimelate decarboxylase [unclassified Endozoicomonas]|uniref:diaminopimelate decarboxylase n=1 Tax=unclassified Endozoicomonas TaxID=2644528 RepID=UPI003BB550F9